MNTGLLHKVALIGGASKGLGRGCALQLAREGVNVALCARGRDALNETAAFIRKSTSAQVLPIVADLSKKDDVQKAVDAALAQYRYI